MADSIWNIYTNGKDKYDFFHYSAEYIGRWEESIESITKKFSNKNWSTYSTFTKSDYNRDPELYDDFPIEYNKLPENKRLFDSKSGITRFTKLKEIVMINKEIFEDDFDLICKDINQIIALLEKAKNEDKKWYLDIEVDY